MVVVPLPEPEFVIVPMLLMEVVESKVKPIVGLLIVILPVPVTPPVNIRSPEEPPVVEVNVRLLFNVTAPLKVGLQLLVALILNVPLLPEATVIGLANVPSNRPCNVAAALPLVSPIVTTLVFAPKALALVWPSTVPALIVNPPVKVLAPLKVRVPVPALVTAVVPEKITLIE